MNAPDKNKEGDTNNNESDTPITPELTELEQNLVDAQTELNFDNIESATPDEIAEKTKDKAAKDVGEMKTEFTDAGVDPEAVPEAGKVVEKAEEAKDDLVEKLGEINTENTPEEGKYIVQEKGQMDGGSITVASGEHLIIDQALDAKIIVEDGAKLSINKGVDCTITKHGNSIVNIKMDLDNKTIVEDARQDANTTKKSGIPDVKEDKIEIQDSKDSNQSKCTNCGLSLKSDWNACPECGIKKVSTPVVEEITEIKKEKKSKPKKTDKTIDESEIPKTDEIEEGGLETASDKNTDNKYGRNPKKVKGEATLSGQEIIDEDNNTYSGEPTVKSNRSTVESPTSNENLDTKIDPINEDEKIKKEIIAKMQGKDTANKIDNDVNEMTANDKKVEKIIDDVLNKEIYLRKENEEPKDESESPITSESETLDTPEGEMPIEIQEAKEKRETLNIALDAGLEAVELLKISESSEWSGAQKDWVVATVKDARKQVDPKTGKFQIATKYDSSIHTGIAKPESGELSQEEGILTDELISGLKMRAEQIKESAQQQTKEPTDLTKLKYKFLDAGDPLKQLIDQKLKEREAEDKIKWQKEGRRKRTYNQTEIKKINKEIIAELSNGNVSAELIQLADNMDNQAHILEDNSKGYFEAHPDMEGDKQHWRTELESKFISLDYRDGGSPEENYKKAMKVMDERKELELTPVSDEEKEWDKKQKKKKKKTTTPKPTPTPEDPNKPETPEDPEKPEDEKEEEIDIKGATKKYADMISRGSKFFKGENYDDALQEAREEYETNLMHHMDKLVKEKLEGIDPFDPTNPDHQDKLSEINDAVMNQREALGEAIREIHENKNSTKFKNWWRKSTKLRMIAGLALTGGAIIAGATGAGLPITAGFLALRTGLSGVGTTITIEGSYEWGRTKYGKTKKLDQETINGMTTEDLPMLEEIYAAHTINSSLKGLKRGEDVAFSGKGKGNTREDVTLITQKLKELRAEKFKVDLDAKKESSETESNIAYDAIMKGIDQAEKSADKKLEDRNAEILKSNKKKWTIAVASGLIMASIIGIRGINHLPGSPKPTADAITEGPPEGDAIIGDVTPEVPIEAPIEPFDGTVTIEKGDNVWNIIKDQVKTQMGEEKWDALGEGQQTHLIDQFKDTIADNPQAFGLDNPDNLEIGQQIDLSSLYEGSNLDTAIDSSATLTESQIENIVTNNDTLQDWVANNPGKRLTSDLVNRILNGDTADSTIEVASDSVAATAETTAKATAESVVDTATDSATTTETVTDTANITETSGAVDSAAEVTADVTTETAPKAVEQVKELLPVDENWKELKKLRESTKYLTGRTLDRITDMKVEDFVKGKILGADGAPVNIQDHLSKMEGFNNNEAKDFAKNIKSLVDHIGKEGSNVDRNWSIGELGQKVGLVGPDGPIASPSIGNGLEQFQDASQTAKEVFKDKLTSADVSLGESPTDQLAELQASNADMVAQSQDVSAAANEVLNAPIPVESTAEGLQSIQEATNSIDAKTMKYLTDHLTLDDIIKNKEAVFKGDTFNVKEILSRFEGMNDDQAKGLVKGVKNLVKQLAKQGFSIDKNWTLGELSSKIDIIEK